MMKFKNSFSKKRIRRPIANILFIVWMSILWAIIGGIIFVELTPTFKVMDTFHWWWIFIGFLGIVFIFFFSLWLKNLFNYLNAKKVNEIKDQQSKLE